MSPVSNRTASDNKILAGFNPMQPMRGVLPNGEILRWNLLDQHDVPDILALQDAVAGAATAHEKRFLIQREAANFRQSMTVGHLYWGGWVEQPDGQYRLIAMFGIAENDEEIGDGRGEATPLSVLGVTRHAAVDILKAAQVHPDYREQGLAALGALCRYAHFINDPRKKVLMTKTHGENFKVKDNYRANGFVDAFRCRVTDRDETFDLVTLKADRALISGWLNNKTACIMTKFQLQKI